MTCLIPLHLTRAVLLAAAVLLAPSVAAAQVHARTILQTAFAAYDSVLLNPSVADTAIPMEAVSVIEALGSSLRPADACVQRRVTANLHQLAGALSAAGTDTTTAAARQHVARLPQAASDGRLAARIRNDLLSAEHAAVVEQYRQVLVARAISARASILFHYQALVAFEERWQRQCPSSATRRALAFGGGAAAYGADAFGGSAAVAWGAESSRWLAQVEYAFSTDGLSGSEISVAAGREVGGIAILAGASYGPDRETELAPAATVLVRVRPGAYVGAALSAQHGAGFRVLLIPTRWRR